MVARVNGEVPHRRAGEIASLVLGPLLSAVERDPEPELGSEVQEVMVHTVSALRGDSQMAKIVVCISADELSTVTPPDCSCFCFSGSFVVKSGEILSHFWPWSWERNRN